MEPEVVVHEESGPTIPVATEILGYVGGSLAVSAVAALVGAYWEKLGVAGQLSLVGLVAVAGLLGGWLIGRVGGKAARRLEQYLLMVGVLGIGGVAGIAAWHVADPLIHAPAVVGNEAYLRPGAGEWAFACAYLAATVFAALIYQRRQFVLQQIVLAVSLVAFVLSAVPLILGRTDVPVWGNGLVFVVLGVVWWVAGSAGLLRSQKTALSLSGAATLLGLIAIAQYAAELSSRGAHGVAADWPLYIGLLGAAAMLGVGGLLRQIIVVGFGSVGLVIFVPATLSQTFGSAITVPFVVLVIGMLLIGLAVGYALRRRRLHPVETRVDGHASIESTAETPAPESPRPIPLISEILGYAGGAFVLGAGIALIAVYWNQIGVPGQLGLSAAAAIAAMWGGYMMGGMEGIAARRLEQFQLAIGALCVGGFTGVAGYHVAHSALLSLKAANVVSDATDWALFLGSLGAAIAGGLVWRRRPSALQEIVFGVAVAASSLTVLALPQSTGPDWIPGAVLVGVGVVWGAMGFAGWVRPMDPALALAALGVLGGLEMVVVSSSGQAGVVRTALLLGVLASAAMVAGSIRLRRVVALIIGAVGVVAYVPQLVEELLPDTVSGPVVVLLVGVLLIGAAVTVALVAPKLRNREGSAV